MTPTDKTTPDAAAASTATPAAATPTAATPSDATPAKTHSPLLSLLAILLALVGGALSGYAFLTGVANQFSSTPDRSSLYVALFFVGLGIVIVGIVFALVGIIRRAHRVVSLVALVLSMLPSFIVLVIAALLFL
jgi:hypothetical protein